MYVTFFAGARLNLQDRLYMQSRYKKSTVGHAPLTTEVASIRYPCAPRLS